MDAMLKTKSGGSPQSSDSAVAAVPNMYKPAALRSRVSSDGELAQVPQLDTSSVEQKRREHIGPNSALMYSHPIHMVRGEGIHLYDADGNEYLDCVNNVAHVGHCHPKVAQAVADQMFTLNTNSRYLHQNLVLHAERLTATMPEPLSVMYATTSGSESNDLALRIARANTDGAMHVAVMDGAYHGHTTAVIDLSPYKFDGPGGEGKPAYIHVLPCPDVYRGLHLDGRAAARAAIAEAEAQGAHICAFFSESILSCGGQVVLPEGYLEGVYAEMRGAGAVCVADEVQCGFGRVGSHFWAFETQGVVPDIVTLGKPIGNGFPMGATVTSPALAKGFANGMEYFSTCGGCTAAGAAGLAVLQVIEEEELQQHALDVGDHLMQRLWTLVEAHDFLGDVRGLGLMIGIECVTDKQTKRHAPRMAKWIREQMKARHILLTTDGPKENILKIKPPLVFSRANADQLVEGLSCLLGDVLPLQDLPYLLAPASEVHVHLKKRHLAEQPEPTLPIKR